MEPLWLGGCSHARLDPQLELLPLPELPSERSVSLSEHAQPGALTASPVPPSAPSPPAFCSFLSLNKQEILKPGPGASKRRCKEGAEAEAERGMGAEGDL